MTRWRRFLSDVNAVSVSQTSSLSIIRRVLARSEHMRLYSAFMIWVEYSLDVDTCHYAHKSALICMRRIFKHWHDRAVAQSFQIWNLVVSQEKYDEIGKRILRATTSRWLRGSLREAMWRWKMHIFQHILVGELIQDSSVWNSTALTQTFMLRLRVLLERSLINRFHAAFFRWVNEMRTHRTFARRISTASNCLNHRFVQWQRMASVSAWRKWRLTTLMKSRHVSTMAIVIASVIRIEQKIRQISALYRWASNTCLVSIRGQDSSSGARLLRRALSRFIKSQLLNAFRQWHEHYQFLIALHSVLENTLQKHKRAYFELQRTKVTCSNNETSSQRSSASVSERRAIARAKVFQQLLRQQDAEAQSINLSLRQENEDLRRLVANFRMISFAENRIQIRPIPTDLSTAVALRVTSPNANVSDQPPWHRSATLSQSPDQARDTAAFSGDESICSDAGTFYEHLTPQAQLEIERREFNERIARLRQEVINLTQCVQKGKTESILAAIGAVGW
eukprot:CAMPEP_0197290188 /NCGR_PEP_ID=MMETSP0890-20130614/7434_1 /TAXON_ID=44058 ORGANISM="Aureoumbra lagunensis, Strain CCMP1510" /NCGR_SAMPLE_ID=MMETSP0890 /ASSEMBLY_ACC=CAM_ASM_000533 /LENGTH=506 /DNA_ID=CAMNT_0042762059 /DNA_START=1511 /DNA_END=3028 /DNA_ORIENTATION=+